MKAKNTQKSLKAGCLALVLGLGLVSARAQSPVDTGNTVNQGQGWNTPAFQSQPGYYPQFQSQIYNAPQFQSHVYQLPQFQNSVTPPPQFQPQWYGPPAAPAQSVPDYNRGLWQNYLNGSSMQ